MGSRGGETEKEQDGEKVKTKMKGNGPVCRLTVLPNCFAFSASRRGSGAGKSELEGAMSD